MGVRGESLTSDMSRCLTCARRSALWHMHVHLHLREEPLVLEHMGTAVLPRHNVTKSSFLISTMQHGVKITTVFPAGN